MRHALLCLLLLIPPFARAEEEAVAFDRLLPGDTLVYVGLHSVSRTIERYRDGALRAFWEDPAIATFTAGLRKGWGEAMAGMKEKTGVSLEEALEVVSGELALFVPAGGLDDGATRYVLLADVGGNGERVREILAGAERLLLEGDRHRRFEEEFRGVTIVSYQSTEEKKEAEEEGCGEEVVEPPEPVPAEGCGEDLEEVGPEEFEEMEFAESSGGNDAPTCWCLEGNLLAAASDVETLKMHLAYREDDAAPRLADHEPYRRVLAKTGTRRDLVAYLGYPSMVKALNEDWTFDEEGARIFDAVGLASIDAIGGQLGIERDGFGIDIFVGVPGKKTGVLKLFDAPNEGLRPPLLVDPSVDGVNTWAVDLPGLWVEFRRIANTIEPGLLATVDGGLEMLKGASGVDLQADFIGALGKEITWYSASREAAGGGAETGAEGAGADPEAMPSFVLAVAITDRQKLDGALGGLLAAAQAQGMVRVEEEEYLGIKIHSAATPFGIKPCYALLPDHLLISLAADDLKAVVRRVGKEVKSLRDTEEFERCAARLPEGRIVVGFTREARAMRQSFLGGFMLGFAGAMRGGPMPFDMDAFPPLEVLERYLDIGSASMTNDEAGIHLRYFTAMHPPRPK